MAEQGIPVIGPFLNWLIGTRNERFVKRYTARVNAINALEPRVRQMTDAQLRAMLHEFRDRIKKGAKPDDLLVEVFAVAREAMDRGVGIRNIFDPRHNFDPTRLPDNLRELYLKTRAEMDALPALLPRTLLPEPGKPAPQGAPDEKNEYLGAQTPVPGWMQVDIPIEIYDAVRQLYPESKPPFRARPFDVQLIGGMVLAQGKIAEMRTGEGKTIVGPLACYLACVERRKVHVVTVNDYLVQRDRDWTFPFFRALGLTVGAIHPMHLQPEEAKRHMYRCDVVYGTTAEFGFDYLRDNMKRSVEQQVQRRREFAIVDEVDSILIDEARTPLIISGPAHEDAPRYDLADRLARHLVEKQRPWQEQDEKVQRCKERIKGLEGDIRQARDKATIPALKEQLDAAKAELPKLERERAQFVQYYELHPERKAVHISHDGIAEAQRVAAIGSFYVDENMDVPHLLEQSLRAHAVYQRDKDYVIMPTPDPMTGRTEPGVVIVDVFTGRPMVGRQWSDGLHQAVECKEKVPIKQETQTVATVTIQNFFKMYKRLAGMTGTADTEAQEFHDIYRLDVVSIPTNKPMIRADFNDLMYLRAKDKWAGIVDEIKAFHDVGRPVLVGTTSVEKSETLSRMLTGKHGIKHEVLNAKQHEREAHIIENAGQLGAVMIATNMAGRGTDIKLGALTREAMLDHWLRRGICPRTVTVESTEEQLREAVYRKIAPRELSQNKRDVETMPFAELEIELLRHWALQYTLLSPKQIDKARPEDLRRALDEGGRFLLHKIRWFSTIEDMGGLHVIGTERHEARRIDNQLRGRSGRQGDKGSSRFYVSLEDDLMKMFAGETQMKILARLGMKEGDSIEHPWLTKSVERAQRKVEERNFQIRKNILEYDEVMEHQRQHFYGLRQRVLEGRGVKGLILDYIRDAARDACGEYLDKEYPATCVAEFAKDKIECSIDAAKLRGLEPREMDRAIRDEAKADVRTMIELTLGEYIQAEGSDASVDLDKEGLIRWAKNRFGVELGDKDLGANLDRRQIQRALVEAAERRIDEADLNGLDAYLVKDYGALQLVGWVKNKFGFDIRVDELTPDLAQKVAFHVKDQSGTEIDVDQARATMASGAPGADAAEQRLIDWLKATYALDLTRGDLRSIADREVPPEDILVRRVEALYAKREVEYPVEFAMEMTMVMARQNPQVALAQLAAWANRRFGLGYDEAKLRGMPPVKVRDELLAASKTFVESGRLDQEIDAALACTDDESLEKHLKDRFGVGLPDWMRWLDEKDRPEAIRGRIESILRAEQLQFEQTILLDTLDTSWKDHLYGMDQLRDTIGFRAYSQQDPRIEYKREGSRQFKEAMNGVRDRITDYLFKVRLSPMAMAGMGGGGPPPPPRPRPPAPPPGASPYYEAPSQPAGSGISGPGLDMPRPAPATAPAAAERHQRDLDAAQRAGTDGKSLSAAQAQVDAARAAKDADKAGKRKR